MGRVYGAIGRLGSCSDVNVEEMLPVEASSSGKGKHQKRVTLVDDAQINQDNYITVYFSFKSFKLNSSVAGIEPTIWTSPPNTVDHHATEDTSSDSYY